MRNLKLYLILILGILVFGGCTKEQQGGTYEVKYETKVPIDFQNADSILQAFVKAQFAKDKVAMEKLMTKDAIANESSLFGDMSEFSEYQMGVSKNMGDKEKGFAFFFYRKQSLKEVKVAAKYDYFLIQENGQWLVNSSSRLDNIKIGKFETATQSLMEDQNAVNRGDNLWRLDPVLTVKIKGKELGFWEGDIYFSFDNKENTMEIMHNTITYKVLLYQPFQKGSTGIWAIKEVSVLSWGNL